jgi:hypothetical protein
VKLGPTQIHARMGISIEFLVFQILAGGICSKISIEVQGPTEIQNAVQFGENPRTDVNDGSYYIEIPNSFPSISYDGGQIAFEYNGTIYTPQYNICWRASWTIF